jgi:hypothetical protein
LGTSDQIVRRGFLFCLPRTCDLNPSPWPKLGGCSVLVI